jgi:outer membrane protein assembly factor BamB
VRDGKTGARLCNEKSESDKRLWPYLDEPARFGAAGKLKADESREVPPPRQVFKFGHAGEPLPFFRRYRLTLEFGTNRLLLTDRTTGEQRWKNPGDGRDGLPIPQTNFQAVLASAGAPQANPNGVPIGFPGGPRLVPLPPPSPRFDSLSVGHLMVVPVANMVYGIDSVRGEVLWSKNLLNPNGAAGPTPGVVPNPSVTVDPRDGSVLAALEGGWSQRLGAAGPLDGAAAALQLKDGLAAVDPVSGRTLWVRADVGPRSYVFGDDEHLFVVEVSAESGAPQASRVLQAYDGAAVKAPDFAALYKDRIRLVGRDLLVSSADDKGVTLRLYDPLTGKDAWKQAFAPKSLVLEAVDCDLAGVVEPDGRLRVIDLATKKELLTEQSKIDPKDVEKIGKGDAPEGKGSVNVLYDGTDVYVACNNPPTPMTQVLSNLMPGTGLRALNVNGEFYAFRAENGRMDWKTLGPVENQQLVLDQFADMPMVLFTATAQKMINQGAVQSQATELQAIEKRTGKSLRKDNAWGGGPFHTLELDPKTGKLDFIAAQEKLSIGLQSDEPKAPPPSP